MFDSIGMGLHYSVVKKRPELLIFKTGFVPILTCGHEYWVMTETVRSQVQASDMSILRRIKGVTPFNKIRSFEIQKPINI